MADLEPRKEALRDRFAEAYARGVLDEDAFEGRLQALEAVPDDRALALIEAEATALLPVAAPAEPQVLRVTAARLRKTGPWFRSGHIRVEGERSVIRLDFSDLAAHPGSRVLIDLALEGSTCRIILPYGTAVEEELENEASVIRLKPRGENLHDLGIVVRGKAVRSVVKIQAKRRP